jgi:tetratricopeptide (TPR) repeat protein
LANLYKIKGKYEQAEPLYVRALEIKEQQLGAQHPDTALCLNNLAALYRAQSKYEQAESLYRRALLIYEHQLGGAHPDTARCINNLAFLYKAVTRGIKWPFGPSIALSLDSSNRFLRSNQ